MLLLYLYDLVFNIMEYNSDKLFASFKEECGNFGFSDEDLKLILRTPFRMINEVIDSGVPTEIRLTYFGVFKPIKNSVDESGDKFK